MRLTQWSGVAVLLACMPLAQASEVDAVYGADPQANAVLACHADYAKRYASAMTAQRATASEVAVAAQAKCAAEFQAFVSSRPATVQRDAAVRAMLDTKAWLDEEAHRMREYAYAYTLNAYLGATAKF